MLCQFIVQNDNKETEMYLYSMPAIFEKLFTE